MKMTYAQQLKHPNWQKRRLERLQISGWQCDNCGGNELTLHVHHKQYFKGRMAWEYSDDELATLCEECHEDAHRVDERIKELLVYINPDEAYALLAGYFSPDGIHHGQIEEARQSCPVTFINGFVGRLHARLAIEKCFESAKFAAPLARQPEAAKELLEENKYLFGME